MKLQSLLAGTAFLGALALPGAAAAATSGYVTVDLNLRAGPSTAYPVVTTMYDGAPVTIYGCQGDWGWCDIGYEGLRGWAAGNYLQVVYESQPVYLPTYAPRIGLPIVTFEFGTYWDRYYYDRPWYRERDRWYGYWRDRDDRWRDRDDRRDELRDRLRDNRERYRDRLQDVREELREERREDRREDRREVREDRDDRREARDDRRRENQQEARQERRQEQRQEARQERRQEQRQEVRQERRQEQRQEVREERRRETRQEVRQDRRQERREVRQERRSDRAEARQERRGGGGGDNCRTRRNGEVVCR
jgi:uncharacterized protein YraI